MVFVEPIPHPGTDIVLALDGNRKAHSFTVVIGKRGATTGAENDRINDASTGNHRILPAGVNVYVVRAIHNFRLCAKTGYLG